MITPWEQTLEQQVQLWAWWGTQLGLRYADHFVTDSKGRGQGHPDWTGASFRNVQRATLSYAEPIYVTPDVLTLAEHAALTFQPEPLAPEDLIVEAGFCLLPRAVECKDIHGKRTPFRAISWIPVQRKGTGPQGAIMVSREKPQIDGVAVAIYSGWNEWGDYADDAARAFTDRPPGWPDLTLLYHSPWRFGDARLAAAHWEVGAYPFVQCLWRLMAQTITTDTRTPAPRQARKRYARAGIPLRDIRVIRLRRAQPKKPAGEHQDVDWQARWVVSGHWRNQWFPSTESHRQIWIHPFIKGPEDKPLRPSPLRAWVASR